MAEKNIEEVKTKLVCKLYKIRSECFSYRTYDRFQKTTKRIKNLKKEFLILNKRSNNTLLIGRRQDSIDDSIVEFKGLSLEDLKIIYS